MWKNQVCHVNQSVLIILISWKSMATIVGDLSDYQL